MKRFILPILAMLGAGLLTSCFQQEATITLKKDGSGTLTEETALGDAMLQMMEQFAGAFGGENKADPVADLRSEEKAKARAAKFGEGVTISKIDPIDKAGWKGARTEYRFADINKLTYFTDSSAKEAMPKMPGQEAKVEPETKPLTFKYVGEKLTVSIPTPPETEKPAGEKPPAMDMNSPEAQQAMQMFKGAKMGLKIVIESGISSTDATHVSGNEITLTEVKLDKLIENPEAFKKLSELGQQDQAKVIEAMKGFEGVKIEPKQEITISVN